MLRLVLAGVLGPTLVSAVAVALAWQPWRRTPKAGRWSAAVLALGLGAGYLAGHVAISGWPPLAPVESTQWLFYLVLGASLLGALEPLGSPPPLARAGVWLLLVMALLWLTSSPLVRYSWSRPQAAAWLGALLVYLLLVWGSTESACRESGLSRVAVWIVLACGASLVLLLSGSARLAQMLGAVAAALAVPALVLLARPDRALPSAVLTGPLVAAVGLALNGLFYTEMRPLAAVFVAGAPFAAWVARLDWVAARRPWLATLLTAAAVMLVLVPAVVVAAVDGGPAEDDYYR